MPKDVLVDRAIEMVREMLLPDGGDATLVELGAGRVRVAYRQGVNAEGCGDCIMSADDLAEFIGEVLRRQAPHLGAVEVIVETAPA